MRLKNPFPSNVRNMYLFNNYECWICGSNGSHCGGMELHHIWGCISDSALNSAPLCKGCHVHILYTRTERIQLFRKTMRFLMSQGYELDNTDNEFLEKIGKDLAGYKP